MAVSFITREEFDRTVNDLRSLIPAVNLLNGANGIIVAWAGNIADVPDGWHICNGGNGTPDLRSKFIRGCANGVEPGGTGGANQHTHANHAAMSHSGADVDAHAGDTAANGSGISIDIFANASDLGHNVTQPSDHPVISHANANNIPPYYELIFLMWNPGL